MFDKGSFVEAHFVPLCVKLSFHYGLKDLKRFRTGFVQSKYGTESFISRISVSQKESLIKSTSFWVSRQSSIRFISSSKAARDKFDSIKFGGNRFSLYLRSMNGF